MHRLRALFDPFIVMLLGTVLLATVLPARGLFVPVVSSAATAAIVALFFLHGAKLSRTAIVAGASAWRLHLCVLAATFIVFPVFGLIVAHLPFLSPMVASGLLFLTLLPSTVQSSIAFTAIARGNVAAAVCSASFSNLLGIVVTPLLVTLTMGGVGGGAGVGFSWASAETIALQLLLPFVLGHLLRPWIGGFVTRHKALVIGVDRGSILLVVYAAFGAAVVEGLWSRISPGSLLLIAALSLVLLGAILAATWFGGRALGFAREDAIVLQFCGSKKSLASGVPMAGVLFPAAQVGVAILPLMIFHQVQLIACAALARRYAAQAAEA
ncbi:bile acid:sodium symporter family protein [Sphingomonas sp. RB3P16]|uniref:bile acid:sodium symporter family protein n=1 Tax=Parasphingomonas frigoris TaxID=3096163 RepID=UPI002FC7A170